MENEIAIRLICFLAIFAAVAIGEHRAPRRDLTTSKKARWISNLSLTIVNPVLLHLVMPVLAVDVALLADQRSWGLLNLYAMPFWAQFIAGVVLLDLAIYFQHVMFHAIPLLWRLHMIHHADLDIDLTTGLRFHPLEIILSMIIKVAVVVILGAPVAAVLVFEVLLNGMSTFNHGNLTIPVSTDKWLRRLVVTPDMHRVHHSVIIRETNSNYGFNLSVWDRLFGTYRDQPQKGHTAMTIGLSQFRDENRLTLPWLLILPVVGDPGRQPINHH
jgi:sterol desaturase/sphingolipid hydroxylase (fatty acid hydroxylase superfamily)